MSLSAYSTQFMTDTVLSLRSLNRSSFMLDTFFRREVAPTGAAEIMFDVEDDALGVAPFVSPLREGVVLPMLGHQTKYFKPAYIKPKTPINPLAVLSRQVGEAPAGSMSVAQREQAIVVRHIDDHIGRIARRLELMAIDALVDGKTTVTGEGFASVEVNFGRTNTLTKALTDAAEWGDAGVSPVDDLDSWLYLVAAATGIQPDVVVMDALAWKFYEADAKLEKRRDINFAQLPGAATAIAPGASSGIVPGTAKLRASLDGGAVKIYTYQQQYKHPTTGVITNMIPDYSVFVGCSDTRATGTRYFGTVIDPSIDYSSGAMVDPASGMPLDIAVKTWVEQDPPIRMLMSQCAPLPALTRPDATLYASVKAA